MKRLNRKSKNPVYRNFVGPIHSYDLVAANQFNLLTSLGLRESHYLLDIGCGSLRGGKLFIPYLLKGRYFGLEPERWLVDQGIDKEIGPDLIGIKQPTFSYDSNFSLTRFNKKFDFLLAQSIFTHTSQQQIRRCLSQAKKVMKLNSIFVASILEGKKNYSGRGWVYPAAITYDRNYLISLIEREGLKAKVLDFPHPNFLTWLVIFNPKNERNIPKLDSLPAYMKSQMELRFYKEKITLFENNPVIKLGFRVRNIFKKTKFNLYRSFQK